MKRLALFLFLLLILQTARTQDFERVEKSAGLESVRNTNGVAVADYDGDGDLDVYFTGIKNFDPAEPDTWSRLMRNRGDGTFEDVTVAAGFGKQYVNMDIRAERGEKMGASWGDYDNDGYPDLFLANSRFDQLYHNNGDGSFTDITAKAGVAGCNTCYSSSGLWWDHDRDGDLDLYVSVLNGANIMYENRGNGTFRDVTESLGLAGNNTITWASVAWDAGKDGFLDLLNVNDTQAKEFFENRSGQRYNEAARAYRLDNTGAGMGVAIGDVNNDGLFDIYITNIYNHLPNPLFIDTGNRRFSDQARALGVENTGWGWGTHFLDYDHDGDEDLAAVNGPIDKLQQAEQPDVPNVFFKNMLKEEGAARFVDWSKQSGHDGLAKGKGLEVFDCDRDGDLDMVVANMLEAPYFLKNNTVQNETPKTKNWLQVKLEGTVSNRDGFGTTVQIKIGNKTWYRYHHGAAIFGQSIKPLHFGVGDATLIDEIRFTWLTGVTEAVYKVPVNQILSFKEGTGKVIKDNTPVQDTVKAGPKHSIARLWNENVLFAISNDLARPTVHARNLFHTAAALYDAWAVYRPDAETYFLGKTVHGFTRPFKRVPPPKNVAAAQAEAMSFAVYRLLKHRFAKSPGAKKVFPELDRLMDSLGYDGNNTGLDYACCPAEMGNFIARWIIDYGLQDGSNEVNEYANLFYQPVNPPLRMDDPGNPHVSDLNRWQPLQFAVFVDQSGNVSQNVTPKFLSPEWGRVAPFSLKSEDAQTYRRSGQNYTVYHDPGPPAWIDTLSASGLADEYKWNHALVSVWSSLLDAADPTQIDISPASIGNNTQYPTDLKDLRDFYDLFEGGDTGAGHNLNPKTGAPYVPQWVQRGDYTRVLAEFWADGPNSETPPGHWFSILNYVNDHPALVRKLRGQGREIDKLEWDVKGYFTLGGAMHDAAVTAWGIKGWYDSSRPVTAIRGMAELGQSSDPALPSFHPGGLPLIPGYVELILPGDPLQGNENQYVGQIKIKAWRGPKYVKNPAADVAGTGWIRATEWWPYQRPTFVSPPFAGYISGHSTYSRAAAEVLTTLTGDPFFPGGMGEFHCPRNEYLVFEDGPSRDITLQWATYRDASDQCSLSRIYGGIHPPMDDMPGRLIGRKIGVEAFDFAERYFTRWETLAAPLKVTSYPNPAVCALRIEGDVEGLMTVQVFSADGRLARSETLIASGRQVLIDISDLGTGVYIAVGTDELGNRRFAERVMRF